MKILNFLLIFIFTINSVSEEGRLDREPNDYKYTSIGIDLIQSDETGIGTKI